MAKENYLVTWTMLVVDADSHRDAADEALRLLRKPDEDVTTFTVQQMVTDEHGDRVPGDPVEIDPMVDL